MSLPTVSICTPTYNRRIFFNSLTECILLQDYPKEKMEWIIVDDGSDLIEDIVEQIQAIISPIQLRYYKYNEKMSIGKKRNLLISFAKGDIVVNMDDDDYYPPQRVSHAVEELTKNPDKWIAGLSEVYVVFPAVSSEPATAPATNPIRLKSSPEIKIKSSANLGYEVVQFGPYHVNHATAATFAFQREKVLKFCFDENDLLGEESKFLKGFTIPLIQLNPTKTILVFSHSLNTFDKKRLLTQNVNTQFIHKTTKNPEDFFSKKATISRDFFLGSDIDKGVVINNAEKLINQYLLEKPFLKTDLKIHSLEIENKRLLKEVENKTKIIEKLMAKK